MKTNEFTSNNQLKVNKKVSFEILSDQQAATTLGGGVGGWLYRASKKLYRIVRDGVVYDMVVDAGKWVYENINPQPTEQDLKRAEQGYTHLGGRQPWI